MEAAPETRNEYQDAVPREWNAEAHSEADRALIAAPTTE
jgi:hypothetical protein